MDEAEEAVWRTPQDIKQRYPNASFLSENRVVFNLGGNNYRLLVQIRYSTGIVDILDVGTRAEYNKWNL